MKSIAELYRRYKSQPIWIVGSDASLDTYPDNFLENKIGITLHLAHLKFPNATYRYANELDRVNYLRKKYPDYFEKENIFGLPFFKKSYGESFRTIEEAKSVHYLKLKPQQPLAAIGDLVEKARIASSVEFGGFGTCLHASLFVAILMGGNPINIIGCNHEVLNGKGHFLQADEIDKEMRPNCRNFTQGDNEKVKQWTETLIKECLKRKIMVHWLKGYSQMKTFEILLKIKKAFDDLKIPVLLHCGTLLGAYRNKDFLPGDHDDIDLLIMEKNQVNLAKIINQLKQSGFGGPSYFRVKGKIECFGIKREKVHADIGILHIKNEEAYSLGRTGAHIYPAHCFREFDKINFNGVEFDIPHKPEDYLEARYGKDWRIPISKNDWYAGKYKNAPNVRRIDEI